MAENSRDHGGGVDAAVAKWGGKRSDWIDLSTGINPVPYPIPDLPMHDWTSLPDAVANASLVAAARRFWKVPEKAAVFAVPGCSAAIAAIPGLLPAGQVQVAERTYNEHAAAFRHCGWQLTDGQDGAKAQVIVHPNNPTGWFTDKISPSELTVIDESFCDIAPERSHIALADQPGILILKSFGKFWGLAGLRLGFVVGDSDLIANLRARIGPWAVSGPALCIGTLALEDVNWANETRKRLQNDVNKLDRLMSITGANPMGKVSLFRTYEIADAHALHNQLAQAHILTRIFPYADNWIRLGLPTGPGWDRLDSAL